MASPAKHLGLPQQISASWTSTISKNLSFVRKEHGHDTQVSCRFTVKCVEFGRLAGLYAC